MTPTGHLCGISDEALYIPITGMICSRVAGPRPSSVATADGGGLVVAEGLMKFTGSGWRVRPG
jgi:hypothetical protein